MTTPLMRLAVAVMAKAPRPGQVKTRLVPPLTPEAAADLSRAFLLDTIEQVLSVRGAVPVLAYAPADARGELERLAPGLLLVPQLGDDLGARLLSTFDQLFTQGFERVVVMGSDAPTLPAGHLEAAAARLASGEADLVLGPSDDGGYYLIGLTRREPRLFEGMPWSTGAVLGETRRRAEALGLRTVLLPAWFDVDTAAELSRLRESLSGAGLPRARHTRAFLTERWPR